MCIYEQQNLIEKHSQFKKMNRINILTLIIIHSFYLLYAQGMQTFQGVRYYHPSTQGQYIHILPPTGITSYSLILPAIQGSSGASLTNDGSGNLSWKIAWSLAGNTGTNTTSNFIGTTDNIGLSIRTFNTERIHILPTGNVGIGTNIPSEKLQVAGNIYAIGTITSSDLRFKKNIVTIDNALSKVLAMRGVFYDMRVAEFPDRGFSSNHQMGLIAQEVEKVLPEVVSTQNDGYKGVDYQKIIALLIESIKELEQKVKVLENENKN